MDNKLHPTILVILGVTGDLAAKKILPALFNLFSKKKLGDQFKVVGFGRREFTQDSFKEYVSGVIKARMPKASDSQIKSFLDVLIYEHGLFEEANSYIHLAETLNQIQKEWKAKTNRLFYLSVPPEIYELIFRNLKSSGLADHTDNPSAETRILVEKPFGRDLATSEKLDSLLSNLFSEDKIYRIDHYLAKEMVQNFLVFRFLNDIFESTWNNKFIEQIEIRLWEKMGVETRGNFYDGIGALRDVGQNHLLQMLALMTMEKPAEMSPLALQNKRAQVLERIKIPTPEEIQQDSFRAQYDSYGQVQGVKPNSKTETYFKIVAEIDNDRWRGVPIIMESGKRMHEQRKEVIVTYKHSDDCLCPPGEHHRNRIIFEIEPEEAVKIEFWSKTPGLKLAIGKGTINFTLRPDGHHIQYIEEYEKLLLDSILGDRTLFVSTPEVKAMWRFTDPFTLAWQKDIVPLETYEPDTDQAVSKSQQN